MLVSPSLRPALCREGLCRRAAASALTLKAAQPRTTPGIFAKCAFGTTSTSGLASTFGTASTSSLASTFGTVSTSGLASTSLSRRESARSFRLIDSVIWKPRRFAAVWSPPAITLTDLDGVCGDETPDSPHWRAAAKNNIGETDVRLPHAVYTHAEMDAVQITHLRPQCFTDWAAYSTVWTLRRLYDVISGYALGLRNESCMIRRVVILETVAGVPGMVGAAIRHFRSLRKMRKDYGWIHTLLEEAENERMHLMTALLLQRPGRFVRAIVVAAQAGFLSFYTLMYLLSPRYCHKFVGYLEEEAVKTYTKVLELIDKGKLKGFEIDAPAASRTYWGLASDASLRDVFNAIRADEAHHREVNHVFAELPSTAINPFPPGY